MWVGFDEELTTGALVGAISSHALWSSVVSETADGNSTYAWTHYAKSGKSPLGESRTGADFCLILRVAPGAFRAAVFQAKRLVSNKSENQIRTIQISPSLDDRPAEPQIIRLLSFGRSIDSTEDSKAIPSWLHYLVYKKSGISSISLNDTPSGMINHVQVAERWNELVTEANRNLPLLSMPPATRKVVRKQWKSLGYDFKLSTAGLDFVALLQRAAIAPAGAQVNGWLNIQGKDDAASFIQSISPMMRVFEAAELKGYKPILHHAGTVRVPRSSASTIRQIFAGSQMGSLEQRGNARMKNSSGG